MNEEVLESTPDDDGEDRERVRLVWMSEISMVVGCVFVFFCFLSLLIKAFFPQGTSLTVDPNAGTRDNLARSGDVELGINADYEAAEQLFAGEILGIQRRVQRRGANTLTWNNASVGDKVVRNDAVQTFSRSTAVMEINSGSQLTMGENSLIVFDQQQADPFLVEQNSVLVMVDGELSGKISTEDETRFRFDVGLPNSDVTLQPRTPGDDVDFLITVNDDNSTTVNIHEGTAKILGRDGTLKTIGDQQAVTIDASGENIEVSELSLAPRAASPADGSIIAYRNVPEQVEFRWDAVANADRYHIIIARDPEFSDRVVDDDVVGTTFTHGALGPGTYYWNVRSRTGWSQSAHSTVRRIEVRQDLDPPTLELDPPPAAIAAGPWRLHGRTDADASVFIDDVPVEHVDGRIDHPVELNPGANIILVEAVDGVGNLSYAPLLVTAK